MIGENMFWKKTKLNENNRDKSWRVARNLGYPINSSLPPLESDLHLRPLRDILDCTLILHVVCAHAYGLKQSKGKEWIKSEKLEHALSPVEYAFIFDGNVQTSQFKPQVEAIWAFLWIMNRIKDLKFDEHCSNDMVKMMPDLKRMESSAGFRNTVSFKSEADVVNMLDLVYCLHWGQQQYNLETGTWKYSPTIIEERRRALEWAL
jgi:hypothetical protein